MISKFGDLNHTPCGLMGRKAAGRTIEGRQVVWPQAILWVISSKGQQGDVETFLWFPLGPEFAVEFGSSQQVQTKFPES